MSTASASTHHAKQAQTKTCAKRDPPLRSSVEDAIVTSAAATPAAFTCPSRAPKAPRAARRVSRAIPATRRPKLTGPASHGACSGMNGAMKSGQPGVYCENARPW